MIYKYSIVNFYKPDILPSIMVAPNGARPMKKHHAAVPITINEIVEALQFGSYRTEKAARPTEGIAEKKGVGFKRNPPMFMKPGDKVEVEITEIGLLSNTIKES